MVDLSGIASSIIELARGVSPALAPFFIAFFGNVIPYMTVPYLVAIAGYGAALPGFGSKAIAAVSAALGAGLGKVVVFSMGRSIHRVLPQGTRENLSVFASAFRRGVFIAVFIFAALPLPDDVLYVPLGVAGYSLLYFFVAVTLGKLVITSLAILFGNLVKSLVGGEAASPAFAAGLLVASVLVAIMVARMNWKKIMTVYAERGFAHGFAQLLVQVVVAVLPKSLGKRVESRADSLLGLTQ